MYPLYWTISKEGIFIPIFSLSAPCRWAFFMPAGRWLRKWHPNAIMVIKSTIPVDAIQDRFRERTVISSQLIEPALAIILRTKDDPSCKVTQQSSA